jgi:hypothetical protein
MEAKSPIVYALYHTLNKNLESKKFTAAQTTALSNRISQLEKTEDKKAVIMLIAEHYRHTEGVDITLNSDLPYGLSQSGDNVNIPVNTLPNELKWILHKFLSITSGETS